MDQFHQNCSNAGAPMAATTSTASPPPPPAQRKRRRQQITDNDDVEVIALSIDELTAIPVFPCELCNKSFIREQNLLLHQRVHNIPYVRNNRPVKKNDNEKRKVYVCPHTTCAYHNRLNALSDLPSLKKHFKRKHGAKTMKCTKCEKIYAIEGDLKAHLKICGTKEYACVCGSVFSRWNNYVAHKTPCDRALTHQISLLQNELTQTSQTTTGSSFVPTIIDESISNHPNNQPAHRNMVTFDPVTNNSSTPGNDDIFDVNVLHDRLFGVSSVPAQEAPQQGYGLGNSGNLASLIGSLENPTENNFNVYPNTSGSYENPHQLRYPGNDIIQDEAMGGRNPLLGDYCNTTVNENIFSTSLEDSTMQNGGPSGFGHNQINQLVQLPGRIVGGDANFPVVQNNFHFWKNWEN